MILPDNFPPEYEEQVKKEYEKYLKMNKKNKKTQQQQKQNKPPPPPPKGMSPMEFEMKRNPENTSVSLTEQVYIKGGNFWFGTQMGIEGKLLPSKLKDGSQPRVKVRVKSFLIDEDCVTNRQFKEFILSTNYKTEAELYGWSFVLDSLASQKIRDFVDSKEGPGRVKDAKHWMGVIQASWYTPYGPDSSIDDILDYPVVQVSHNDAAEYCAWVGDGSRLPTEKEWEYGARGGRINETYPWGNKFKQNRMNIWEGDDFPKSNLLNDGYHGVAPVKSYPPNDYGLYNMVGNVWEWVSGGTSDKRILRGGSFIDSIDGKFNHAVMVSTKQINGGDSAASNIGFRCAKTATALNKHTIDEGLDKPDAMEMRKEFIQPV
eukprot:gene6262-8623_t